MPELNIAIAYFARKFPHMIVFKLIPYIFDVFILNIRLSYSAIFGPRLHGTLPRSSNFGLTAYFHYIFDEL